MGGRTICFDHNFCSFLSSRRQGVIFRLKMWVNRGLREITLTTKGLYKNYVRLDSILQPNWFPDLQRKEIAANLTKINLFRRQL